MKIQINSDESKLKIEIQNPQTIDSNFCVCHSCNP